MTKYLSKDRFSLRQVVGMLTVAFLGVSVLAYAAVNLPFTFTAGSPARASEVNANFQATANAIPAMKTTYLQYSPLINSTGTTVYSLQVTPPAAGKMLVTSTGIACIEEHTQGTKGGFIIHLFNSNAVGWDNVEDALVDLPTTFFILSAGTPTISAGDDARVPYHLTGVLSVPSTDPITFSLSAQGYYSASGYLRENTLIVQYFPNALL